MSLFAGLEEIVEANKPMSELTWFKLGGPARYFVRPRSEKELLEVIRRCHDSEVPMYVLGSGSNLLVADEGLDAIDRVAGHAFGLPDVVADFEQPLHSGDAAFFPADLERRDPPDERTIDELP